MTKEGQMVIDVHAHHVAPALLEEAERFGARYGVRLERSEESYGRVVFPGEKKARPFFPKLCELDLRLPVMDAVGIDRQVVSTWTDIAGYDLPPEAGAAWARLQNETLADSIKQFNGRFEAMATLPMQDMDATVAEIDYAVDRLGIRSFEVGTSVNEHPIGEEQFGAFWKKANDVGAFVLLHPPLTPIGAERLDRYFMKNLLSYPMDTAVAGASLMFSGLLDEYADVRILLVHGGGFLPYQFARLNHGFNVNPDCRVDSDSQPSDLISRFYFDTIVYDGRVLDHLLNVARADNVVFGTDYPFEMFDEKGVERVRAVGKLNDSEIAAVLGGNAERLLGG